MAFSDCTVASGTRVAFVYAPVGLRGKAASSAWCAKRPLTAWAVPCRKYRFGNFPVPRCELATPDSDVEEEPLDEVAMRAAEIHEVLKGLEDFKARIIDDATKIAKKVRAPKKEIEKALESHPDIVKIDGHIAELNDELKALGDR